MEQALRNIPGPPVAFLTEWGKSLLATDAPAITAEFSAKEEQRQASFPRCKVLGEAAHNANMAIAGGDLASASSCIASGESVVADLLKESGAELKEGVRRVGDLGRKMEELMRVKAFHHFLTSGVLLPKPKGFSDEEYLCGAIGLVEELERYCIGRAIQRDKASVTMARDLTEELLAELMKFDFRNGNLRRRYDGVKWKLRAQENILYELSVTDRKQEGEDKASPPAKRIKPAQVVRVNIAELATIRARMQAFDDKRELVIKKCRDGQKAAKVAIYSLHRGEEDKATKLLEECHRGVLEILPLIQEEPGTVNPNP